MWIDPDMRRFLWDDEIIDRARAEATLAQGLAAAEEPGLGFWIIERLGEPAAIGFVGLWRRNRELSDPELLYGLLPAWWRQGLATEAAAAALAHAFDTGRFARIVAATDPPNTASVRVMERLGMRFERRGTLEGLDTIFYVAIAAPPEVLRPQT